MTAAPLGGWVDPLVDQLATCEQIPKWRRGLAQAGHRLCVAYGPDREQEGTALAAAYGGLATTTDTLQRVWPNLGDGHIALLVVSGLSQADTTGLRSSLRGLLRNGAILWGLTGPRPNTVWEHCHDTITVPRPEPAFLLRAHRLVVEGLISPPERP